MSPAFPQALLSYESSKAFSESFGLLHKSFFLLAVVVTVDWLCIEENSLGLRRFQKLWGKHWDSQFETQPADQTFVHARTIWGPLFFLLRQFGCQATVMCWGVLLIWAPIAVKQSFVNLRQTFIHFPGLINPFSGLVVSSESWMLRRRAVSSDWTQLRKLWSRDCEAGIGSRADGIRTPFTAFPHFTHP